MKIRGVIIVMLVLSVTLLVSCKGEMQETIVGIETDSTNNTQENVSEQKQKKGQPDENNNDTSEENSYEHTGVIVDTVVDVFITPDIKSERVSQALFNQPVTLLEEQGVWTKVQVVDGYTGWIKTQFIDQNCSSIAAQNYEFRVVVTAKSKRVLSQPRGGITIKEAVMGTEFYATEKIEGSYQVMLPGKVTGWITETGTIQIPTGEKIPETSAEDFVDTAVKLKGTSYLWGGISSWGIDCSGLTYIAARINGIDLQRDAHEQFEQGKKISKSLIKRGDLVFFSGDTELKDITHVGIALGDGTFIHSSSAKGYVTINSLEEPYYQNRLAGVKRLF